MIMGHGVLALGLLQWLQGKFCFSLAGYGGVLEGEADGGGSLFVSFESEVPDLHHNR
jgi:hypothetical protein